MIQGREIASALTMLASSRVGGEADAAQCGSRQPVRDLEAKFAEEARAKERAAPASRALMQTN